MDTVATKQDLRELETRIDARFKEVHGRFDALEARVDGRFKDVDGRFRLLYWMAGFGLTMGAAILLKLFLG